MKKRQLPTTYAPSTEAPITDTHGDGTGNEEESAPTPITEDEYLDYSGSSSGSDEEAPTTFTPITEAPITEVPCDGTGNEEEPVTTSPYTPTAPYTTITGGAGNEAGMPVTDAQNTSPLPNDTPTFTPQLMKSVKSYDIFMYKLLPHIVK